jgi:hypothetical protein
MSEYLFIVPGYSDEDFSFRPLRNLLIDQEMYSKDNILSIEYASLDDQVDFYDFADKVDDIYNEFLEDHPNQRIDVLAHSTGSLVIRAWLYLRRMRQQVRNHDIDCPVEHLFLFAPANFGSDLAKLGRSSLNAVKVSFTKLNKTATLPGNTDLFETGKKILQGLEPASPIQWRLSTADLHKETYFGEYDPSGKICFPFIFAAGKTDKNLASFIVRELQKEGTDSTVRIAGTSLNTRKCKIRSLPKGKVVIEWDHELVKSGNSQGRRKFENIAFAVYGNYDHCGIINGKLLKPRNSDLAAQWNETLPDSWEPLTLLKEAKNISNAIQYKDIAQKFSQITENYSQEQIDNNKGIFQQFFFKITDDTGLSVTDFFIHFIVYSGEKKSEDKELTEALRNKLVGRNNFHIHSVESSYGVLMIDFIGVKSFIESLQNDAIIKMRVFAKMPYNGVSFNTLEFDVFDANQNEKSIPSFFAPHTTTLVEIILDRVVSGTVAIRGNFSQGGSDDVVQKSQ